MQLLVQTILERPDLSITRVNTQETLINPGRSVRLDILASDSNGVLYNIEMQRDNKKGRFQPRLLPRPALLQRGREQELRRQVRRSVSPLSPR